MTKEEKAAYQRGYNAGKKRLHREVDMRRREAARNAFWQRVFIAMLPLAMRHGAEWKIADKECRSLDDRQKLCVVWADEALARAVMGGRI